ncbi:ATP-binding protein [Streptococcus danieliae]|uniref:ATP-binding protein n=1 Tax=Streptococcus danieliae TaxID=747656 RepID=A0A7Z0M7L3_9STRE|nr:ATP-binding protein [Streptococcus danieliae]MBF0700062.1 ATP-binding protein [Streptococcus danieliae]MBF0717794.1 ATP-binding protein [Streptococcus danieliae]NYS49724.1 ATP-binding protein [Streptococcus danieliae]NYS97238.1 ATP-binding protein [Streptococcus danieliae]
MKWIDRPAYMAFLRRHRDRQVMKVVSGVRRSGKSVLFELFQKELIESGVPESQILVINFEDLRYYELRDFQALNQYLESRLLSQETYYIFLDEIQHVEQFELVADSLFIKPNVDLYLTGSNARFMSSDLATNLTGRYVQLEVLPLSFSEYVSGRESEGLSLPQLFNDYLFSGFPYLLQTEGYRERIEYLQGLYSTILLNDVLPRAGAASPSLLERIVRTLLSSLGSPISTNKIRNTLLSQGVRVSNTSLEGYLDALLDSLLFYAVPRFDVKGRNLLQRMEKYYCVDLGFRQLLLPDHQEDLGHMIETIVYLELRRRFSKVYVGNIGKYEVDFIAVTDTGAYQYFQVSLSTFDPQTLERELRPLRAIADQYPKFLLTLDQIQPEANYEGIQKKSLIDWLLLESETML